MVNPSILQSLLASSWQKNNIIQNNPHDLLNPIVVPNSIPVLWFGDLKAYDKSEKKVVTVGINPSRKEFGKLSKGVLLPMPTYRFPLSRSSFVPTFDEYACAMGAYFNNNPLITWFWPNEVALNACGASYGGKMRTNLGLEASNTGLHIDVQAPLATDQWGKLSASQKTDISARFNGDFDSLVEALDPDILIVPINMNAHLPLFVGTVVSTGIVNLTSGVRSVTKYSGIIGGKTRTVFVGWNGTTPFPFANRGTIYSAIKSL